MKLNKEWHQNNRMPKNATLEQKIAWHIEHSINCGCRKMPTKIAELIQKESNVPLLLLPNTKET